MDTIESSLFGVKTGKGRYPYKVYKIRTGRVVNEFRNSIDAYQDADYRSRTGFVKKEPERISNKIKSIAR